MAGLSDMQQTHPPIHHTSPLPDVTKTFHEVMDKEERKDITSAQMSLQIQYTVNASFEVERKAGTELRLGENQTRGKTWGSTYNYIGTYYVE